MRKKVLVAIANNSEEIEAIAVADLLRRAGAEVTVAAVGSLEITAACGTHIVADKLIDDCHDKIFDLIVVPGGLPGAEYLRDNATLTNLLKEQAAAGRFYAGICAAPVIVLQHHGLLQNKTATCHPAMFAQLKNLIKERVVVDGNCITSQAPGTVFEFALKLIELLFDMDRVQKVAKGIVF